MCFNKVDGLYAAGVVGVLMLFGAATEALGQFPGYAPKIYVCQAPTFWCSVPHANPAVPNGSACYCNTVMGPVNGYTIDPTGYRPAPVPTWPQRPRPVPPPVQPAPQMTPNGKAEPTTGDCYKGLGNCSGTFQSAYIRRQKPRLKAKAACRKAAKEEYRQCKKDCTSRGMGAECREDCREDYREEKAECRKRAVSRGDRTPEKSKEPSSLESAAQKLKEATSPRGRRRPLATEVCLGKDCD